MGLDLQCTKDGRRRKSLLGYFYQIYFLFFLTNLFLLSFIFIVSSSLYG